MGTQRLYLRSPIHGFPIHIRRIFAGLLSLVICVALAQPATAFCGFFVARSDAKLSNSASRVVIMRNGDTSTFMMQNNFQGDAKDFARIVPIPVIPTRQQVRIGDNELIDQIDTFTSPRLAEYIDDVGKKWWQEFWVYFPFLLFGFILWMVESGRGYLLLKLSLSLLIIVGIFGIFLIIPSLLNQANKAVGRPQDMTASGAAVTVVDQFTVGEYDVALLDAKESDGLVFWLISNGYKIPRNAEYMLDSYIQHGMKFFVVKINLKELNAEGNGLLRPIVIEYESPRFMLPIRLGTLNATSDQDLTVYILSSSGVAQAANYSTLTIPTDAVSGRDEPSGKELPRFIKSNFSEFYEAVFKKAHEDAGKRSTFLEYAGKFQVGTPSVTNSNSSNSNSFKCDPCTIPPYHLFELSELLLKSGVDWITDPVNLSISRLHVRYNANTFPRDLEFDFVGEGDMKARLAEENKIFKTPDESLLFQGRYVIRSMSGIPFGLSGWKYLMKVGDRDENFKQLTGLTPDQFKLIADAANKKAVAVAEKEAAAAAAQESAI